MGWPDWRGQAVAIVASGPSTKTAGVELLKGRLITFAIKRSIEICPWADAVYGCDAPWWRSVRGLPDFKGLKLAYAPKAVDQYRLRKVEIPKPTENELLFDTVGTVGAGGNSGFQALNLAVQLGAKRVLLVGFDMHDRAGVHWYGRNDWHGGANPSDHNFRRWIAAFTQAAPVLAARGVEVLNASPDSAVKCFRTASIAEALRLWDMAAAA